MRLRVIVREQERTRRQRCPRVIYVQNMFVNHREAVEDEGGPLAKVSRTMSVSAV